MQHFTTLFDSNYLSRGLVLYESLVATKEDFHLYIFCFDDVCHDVLSALKLEHATLVSLSEFENEKLLEIKPTRTKGEYCWTCTSHSIRFVLDRYKLPSVTYLDADMYFYGKPRVLLKEFDDAGASVLITDHRYTPTYDQSRSSGKYCVQFMTFRSDERGLNVLQWWQDRCIEWCYDRLEDGKFGDQKYLDDWITRFPGIHALEHRGGGLAPWNIQQYDVLKKNEKLFVREKSTGREDEVIFFHFHHLRFYHDDMLDLAGYYQLTPAVLENFYLPYVCRLTRAAQKIWAVHPGVNCHGIHRPLKSWKWPLQSMKRRLTNSYNVYRMKKFIGI